MHKHHKVPKYRGGTDEPSNIIEVTVEQHAELHLALYLEDGHWQDWIAYHCLSGQIGKEEAQKLQCQMMGKANAGATRAPLTEEHKMKIKNNPNHRANHVKSYELTFTSGKKCVITNLRKFIRETEYNRASILNVLNGKWKYYKDISAVRVV